VDDAAEGILLVHDRGGFGCSYILGGEVTTLGAVIDRVARLSGRTPPRFTIPPVLVRMAIPIGPLVTRLMGLPPNLREIVRSSDRVTYWASDERARRELGYDPRGLDMGLRDMIEAPPHPRRIAIARTEEVEEHAAGIERGRRLKDPLELRRDLLLHAREHRGEREEIERDVPVADRVREPWRAGQGATQMANLHEQERGVGARPHRPQQRVHRIPTEL
jgi:hypothetical protein